MKERFNQKILSALKEKGAAVNNDALKKIAQGVGDQDLSNEQQLRELIHRVSAAVNIPLSKSKEEKIMQYLRKYGSSPEELKKFIKLFK
jgi:uncharacterized protein YpuA (DUF1002 family)